MGARRKHHDLMAWREGMGLVTDIKQELRRIGALKVVYSTNQGIK